MLKVRRPERAALRAKAEAQRRDELVELEHLERIGRLVNSIERRHLILLEMLGYGLVGEKHELLDQPMRDVAFVRDDVFDQTFFVEDDLGFREIEVNRSAPTAPGVEDCEQLAHQLEHRDESSRSARWSRRPARSE